MKKVLLIALLLASVKSFTQVNLVIGPQVNFDSEAIERNYEYEYIFPSFFWEINYNNLGIGMSYTTNILKEKSIYEIQEYDWYIDWEATFDFKYHLLSTDKIFDPFTEISFGTKTNNMLRPYKRHNNAWKEDDSGVYRLTKESKGINSQSIQSFSIIGKVSGGFNINFQNYFIGCKVGIQIFNSNSFQLVQDKEIYTYPYRISILTGYRF